LGAVAFPLEMARFKTKMRHRVARLKSRIFPDSEPYPIYVAGLVTDRRAIYSAVTHRSEPLSVLVLTLT
jgi:hypothetical protein